MKVLVVNGSPKGDKSATMNLTRAFLEGAGWTDAEIIDISKSNVSGCNGCYSCWEKTPGECVIDDDMKEFLPKLIEADVVITSFPLYSCFFPGQLKCFKDRMLPAVMPFMDKDAESGGHPLRHDFSKQRQFMISTCGFWTAEGNYDVITKLFERGNEGNEVDHRAFCIFCGQGGLFEMPELVEHTQSYLDAVRKAGSEFAAGEISKETQEYLAQPILPREVYEKGADESWDIQE
jgi:multimeric flavodoxin WrbA